MKEIFQDDERNSYDVVLFVLDDDDCPYDSGDGFHRS